MISLRFRDEEVFLAVLLAVNMDFSVEGLFANLEIEGDLFVKRSVAFAIVFDGILVVQTV